MQKADFVPAVVMIGAGNVATHLAPAIERSGAGRIVQVYSRSLDSATRLASKLSDAIPVDSLEAVVTDADIYLISVKDDAIADIVRGLRPSDALVLHTSGSVGMEVLAPLSMRHGVFYPLQTFSKDVELDVERIPLFTEGPTCEIEDEIRAFGAKIFANIYHADSDLRKKMHIAAVFACNFVNHLWTIAAGQLEREGLPFDILQPLLEETLRKALANTPAASQTGPAARGDGKIIESHLLLLDGKERELYEILSRSIMSDIN
ncbi:MAG: DUF2520 domain-containing protein [Staphylococcus sp.]|nr:DUF2520 domain-containing protein [Staphylococcus sp.]